MNQTLEVTALGAVEAGVRVNLELAMQASDRLGGHIVQGHVDGVGKVDRGRRGRLRPPRPRRPRPGAPALRRRQGLDHAQRRQPDDRRAGRGLGRGLADPRDPGADEPGRADAGTQAERRVRHRGEVRGAVGGTIRWKGTSVSQMTETESKTAVMTRGGGEPVRDDRGGDRGDPPRPHGRRLRRRRPRERGRPGDGGAVRHPRGGQLHGQGGARADLPGADRASAASGSAST